MPERLAGAVQQFTDDVGRLHTPLAVLVALQILVTACLGSKCWVPGFCRDISKTKAADWREGGIYFSVPMCRAPFGPII